MKASKNIENSQIFTDVDKIIKYLENLRGMIRTKSFGCLQEIEYIIAGIKNSQEEGYELTESKEA